LQRRANARRFACGGVRTKKTDGPESPLARFNNERDEHQAAIEAMVGAIADAQVN
jgi:hypothetical protein